MSDSRSHTQYTAPASGSHAAGKVSVTYASAARAATPTLEEHYVFRGEMEGAARTILPFHRRMFERITLWSLGELPGGARHLAVCIPPGHGKTFMAHDAITG